MNNKLNNVILFILGFLMISGCSKRGPSEEELFNRMENLKIEIIDLVESSCQKDTSCDVTFFGVKPCGGPTLFVRYSNNMDLSKLKSLTSKYDQANKEYNRLTGNASDCAINYEPLAICEFCPEAG